MSRCWRLFLFPISLVPLAVMLLLIRTIDPLKANVTPSQPHYDLFVLTLLSFLLAAQVIVVLWNAGLRVRLNIFMPLKVSASCLQTWYPPPAGQA